MVALLSQPGAMHDEWYHASSIWCGQGERDPYCPTIVIGEDALAYATTNIDAQNCQRNPESQLLCPTDQSGRSSLQTNAPINNGYLYPRLFYFTMSWFVMPSVEFSIAAIRLVNAFIITALLGLVTLLLPSRYRLVLFLTILTLFTVSGYVLSASLQPSSWTMIGVGFGWLPLHAVVVESEIGKGRRVMLALVGITLCAMALGSRNDGLPFLVFAMSCTSMHVVWLRFPQQRWRIIGASIGIVIPMLLVVESVSRLSPLNYLRSLFSYSVNEPDNLAFFSHYLIQGLPNALEALGTFPTMSAVWVPEIVYIVGLVILGLFVVCSLETRNYSQIIGVSFGVLATSLIIMAQVALLDDRDAFGVEPRYSYPLLVFVVAWWFLTAPPDLRGRVSRIIKPATVVVSFMFALAMFALVERYVDRQTYGLRPLPEGPDQWWWSWMPVGPNVVLVVGVVAMWKFLRHMLAVINHDEETLSTLPA